MLFRRVPLGAGIAAAILATAVGVVSAAPAPDTARAGDCVADGAVRTGAIFNQPHNNDDDKIHRHIVCLTDGAAEGSEIRVATYHFAHRSIKDALLRAHARQVKVKVLVDLGVPSNVDDGPIYQDLQDVIHSDKGEDSWIAACPGTGPADDDDRACIGNAKMHNKFLLFSRTHGVDNVTFLTSSNLEDNAVANNSGTDMWNSGYTFAGDPQLYHHFFEYFDTLSGWVDGQWQDPTNLNYYATVPTDVGNYKVFHSPRKDGSTALDILDKVECHGNSSGGTNPGNRTIVRVSMWNFSGDEDSDPGTKIAQRLWELDNEGCYVDIVADQISDDEPGPLRALLQKPQQDYHGPEVREFTSASRTACMRRTC